MKHGIKKLLCMAMIAGISCSTAMTARADSSWQQNEDGTWCYVDEMGVRQTNLFTKDGYLVGADGIWIPNVPQTQDAPISPADYQRLLGKGLDVTWSEFRKSNEAYNIKMVQDFRAAGVRHVRIRVQDPADDTLFATLDRQIQDCLDNGIVPILAYQAHEFKVDPSIENMNKVTQWWKTVSEHYQNISHLLSFDLVIESSDEVNKQPDKLNQLYEQTVAQIRVTNPTRIIMISPRLRSDPTYLKELAIPSMHNGYLMAEWHFYASGPSKDNSKKQWTTGTEYEKQLIADKINAALEWQVQTGIPTWVGAWMPGDYNKGNHYTVEEQAVFASYMTSQLAQAQIPFAVNADTKYYDAPSGTWIADMQPVFQAIFQ